MTGVDENKRPRRQTANKERGLKITRPRSVLFILFLNEERKSFLGDGLFDRPTFPPSNV